MKTRLQLFSLLLADRDNSHGREIKQHTAVNQTLFDTLTFSD